jgi:hypothetical protein
MSRIPRTPSPDYPLAVSNTMVNTDIATLFIRTPSIRTRRNCQRLNIFGDHPKLMKLCWVCSIMFQSVPVQWNGSEPRPSVFVAMCSGVPPNPPPICREDRQYIYICTGTTEHMSGSGFGRGWEAFH